MQLLMVALGGAIGSVGRYLLGQAIHHRQISDGAMGLSPIGFPWATLLVNVIGAFFIGVAFVVIQQRFAGSEVLRGFILVGVLGGFTTFSTFSIETLQLMQFGLWNKAMLNIIASVVICITAAFMGMLGGRWLA